MTEAIDPLVRLQNDVLRHDMKSAATDAAAVLARDTDLSNPANTSKNLARDAQTLVKAGVSEDTLQQLGILPKAHIEIPAEGNGAVITDGKTSMPVTAKDATTNLTTNSTDHGEPLGKTVKQDGTNTVVTYHYADGWTGQGVRDEDGVFRVVEKAPNSKDNTVSVVYPDGFGMVQTEKDGRSTQVIVYPPEKDGTVFEEMTDEKGKVHRAVKDWHGIKNAPVFQEEDTYDTDDKYRDRVEGEMRLMEYERKKAGIA